MEDSEKFNQAKAELIQKLSDYGIRTDNWGTGSSKTLDHLVKEVMQGETKLEENEQKELIRKVAVAWVEILHKDTSGKEFRLKEERQIFKDGRERKRNLRRSLAEKLKAGEEPDSSSVSRAIQEELGITTSVLSEPTGEDATKEDSPSYPGLMMEMRNYYFEALLNDEQFKPAGYIERQSDKDTYFVWEEKPRL